MLRWYNYPVPSTQVAALLLPKHPQPVDQSEASMNKQTKNNSEVVGWQQLKDRLDMTDTVVWVTPGDECSK